MFDGEAAHRDVWRDELRAMVDWDVVPHLMVIFSARFWDSAWPVLHPEGPGPWKVAPGSFRWAGEQSPWRDRVNAARILTPSGFQPVLQVRLRHPRRPDDQDDLLVSAEFHRVAAL